MANINADIVPLVVKPRGSSNAPNSSTCSSSASRCKCLIPFLLGTVLVTVGVFVIVGQSAEQSAASFKILLKNCKAVCSSRQQQRVEQFGGDLLDASEMLRLVSVARDKAIQQLKVDYGEKYFSDIFGETKDGTLNIRKAFVPPAESTESTERFKRKLKIKLLQVQMNMRGKERNANGCDCATARVGKAFRSGERRQRRRQLLENNDTIPLLQEETFAKFIWTTGGHSASAGHGNLYNESYTAYMERLVKDVFASVGIEFIGKNYAMGGMKSSPEIAFCAEAIFGSDTDAVSWDYGMTDGSYLPWTFRMFLYFNRVGLIPSRPSIFGISVDMGEQKGIFSFFEQHGIAAFMLDPDAENKMREGVPECLGLSTEQLKALPPFVRNFKCDGKIEDGDPYCGAEKYNDAICPDREFKASWHPGWKAHALTGNAMGLFLLESLMEAAKDLASETAEPGQLLEDLLTLEDADHERFLQATMPDKLWGVFDSKEYGDPVMLFAELKQSTFFRGPAICHTGLLPAETRFQGFLTESDKTGFWSYDTGLARNEVDGSAPTTKDKSPMRLTYTKGSRQQCPVPLNVDYKDYFYTNHADGWTTLTIPNDAEAKAYRYDSSKVQGAILVRLGYGEWGNHEDGDLQVNHIDAGNATLEVNGVAVEELVLFDAGYFLKGPDGLRWKPNSEGRFVVRARVNSDKAYLRFSAVVVL